ncbi:MAG TPA: NIPSNAP family protein [Albitalea sp.]
MTPHPTDCVAQVIELRQYTLRPGRREVLIELFEREFVETQQALGMQVLGTFRDLDRPDRFVWLRGFAGMAARAEALAAFYGGPVWQAHREAANATMIDSDDVLLLRPLPPWALPQMPRAPLGSLAAPPGVVIVAMLSWPESDDGTALRYVTSAFAQAGAAPLAVLATEPSPNNFPRLPVREGEPVRVVLSLLRGDAADASRRIQRHLGEQLPRGTPLLRLAPTPRSSLHA